MPKVSFGIRYGQEVTLKHTYASPILLKYNYLSVLAKVVWQYFYYYRCLSVTKSRL